ncbi:hypothetical protein BHM03_00021553 [Ensete ventricosum]|nr:hypothetical protein BHM03_00021553 [Ensete ventricosum]
MEATTSNNTEPLLPSRMSYVCSLSHVDDELRIFRSCIRWMCVDQSDARRAIAFSSLFLLLGVFVLIAFNFILSCAPTYRAYNVVG